MRKKLKVIINERHYLLHKQEELIKLQFGDVNIDEHILEDECWDYCYFNKIIEDIERSGCENVVFISPCSWMIAKMAYKRGMVDSYPDIWIMHSNHKVPIEFGKVTKFVAAKDCYILLPVHA